MEQQETIIKSKRRVKKHGEVFTPRKIVRQMIDAPEWEGALMDNTKRLLEPSAGEGNFLVEILKDRLAKIRAACGDNVTRYENQALLALSTMYGIELLEDNAKTCVMSVHQVFCQDYADWVAYQNRQLHMSVPTGSTALDNCEPAGKRAHLERRKRKWYRRKKIIDSARTIIASNIMQGDFLTGRRADGTPLILTEWRVVGDITRTTIYVIPTEWTWDEWEQDVDVPAGRVYTGRRIRPVQRQMSLFAESEEETSVKRRYIKTAIENVCEEEQEEEYVHDADGASTTDTV